MKQLSFASMSILYLTLPALALAADASYQHSFTTTYTNGSSQEGTLTVGKTISCMRVALPPDEIDQDQDFRDTPSGHEEIIFCKNPQPAMTTLNTHNKTYMKLDQAMVRSMQDQRAQMTKQMGIEPGSDQEKELFKSVGDAMGMMKQKQRESMEEALQNESMSPEDRAKAEAYMKQNFPESPTPSSMNISTNVTDLKKRGSQKGIPCKWYKMEMSGLVHMVNRVCVASWSAIPGGERTKEVMHDWMKLMKDMSSGMFMKNNPYEAIMKIDGFRLMSIKEDGKGNMVSEERYQSSDSVNISYVPPTDYAEESMADMGRNRNAGGRNLIPPSMTQTPQTRDSNKGTVSSIDNSELQPGECKKVAGEIVCNDNGSSTTTGSSTNRNSGPSDQQTEDMQKKVGDLLKGMGLEGLFGGN